MAEEQTEGGCACCAAGSATDVGEAARAALWFAAGARELGISGDDLSGVTELFAAGECAATRQRLSQLVAARLAAAQLRVVEHIEHTASVSGKGAGGGLSPVVAAKLQEAVDLTARVARLQQAQAVLAEPSSASATCGQGCECVTAVTAASSGSPVAVAVSRAALTAPIGDAVSLVCTLDGGLPAMQGRIDEWQAVIGEAIGREPADGGVTLVYDHDEHVLAELARLAGAEFACCSFFTFTLTVGPAGMRFTVTAPQDASEVVTAVFGTAEPAGALT